MMRAKRTRSRVRAPLASRLLLFLLMGIPFAVALFLLVLALSTGMATTLAFGWLGLQAFGYLVLIPRVGLHPLHPMLASQIAIHWLATAFVLFFLMRGG